MKRKLQIAILLCSIAVLCCGCHSDRNPESSVEEAMIEESQSEENENEPNGTATTGNRDEILQLAVNSDGCIEVEGEYSKLSASLQDFNEWIVQKSEELTEQYGEKTYGSVSVQRADSYALGLLVKFRTEESGEVIWQALETRNYNTETGELFALADVFADKNKLSESIEAQIIEEYSSEELPDDIEGQVKNWLTDETKVDWTIGYQGITFYVPLVFGDREETISVMLLFSKYPDLFMDEAISVPDVYAFDMDSTGTFFYDVDDDKDAEKLQLSFSCFVTDDIYEIDSVNLSVDDSSYVGSIDTGVYNTFSKGYLIHMEDRDYICVYAHTMYDNLGGYVVFDLKTGEVCGDEALFFYLDNNRVTNPNEIFVKVKMDPVTWGVTVMEGIWKVNTDGVLGEREDTEYTYNGIVCENTEELEVLVMETAEEENADDTTVLEKGTRFELIRTDGHTWCDIRLQDGSMGRISFEHYVDVEKWMDMREELLPIRFVGENIEEEGQLENVKEE